MKSLKFSVFALLLIISTARTGLCEQWPQWAIDIFRAGELKAYGFYLSELGTQNCTGLFDLVNTGYNEALVAIQNAKSVRDRQQSRLNRTERLLNRKNLEGKDRRQIRRTVADLQSKISESDQTIATLKQDAKDIVAAACPVAS